jgi:hypothetical protein
MEGCPMKKEGGKLKNTFAERICNTTQNEKDGSFTKQGPTDRAGYKPELSASKKSRKM